MPNDCGIANDGRAAAAPWEARAHQAKKDATATAMVGAKLDTVDCNESEDET